MIQKPPKTPTEAERRDHEDSNHATYRAWCHVCVLARGVGPQHRREPKKTAERKDQEVLELSFDYGFMTQEGADTFPILVLRDSRCGYRSASCVQSKGANTYSVALMVGMIRDLGFGRMLLKCDNEVATRSEPRSRTSPGTLRLWMLGRRRSRRQHPRRDSSAR